MKKISTEIMVGAPTSVVWEVLIDLGEYEGWNPFIVSIEGRVEEGSQLRARMQAPGGMATTFKPTVTAVEHNRYFEWLGHLGIRGLFDGRHQFRLEEVGEGTMFTQSEEFTGILAPLLMRLIGSKTEAGFQAMNEALKTRTEQVVAERG